MSISEEAAKKLLEAVEYALVRVRRDPDFADVMIATETLSLMVDAIAAAYPRDRAEVMARALDSETSRKSRRQELQERVDELERRL